MNITILARDGSLLANDGTNGITILGTDGAYLANSGTNGVSIRQDDGSLRPNDGTVPAYSILGTDGALRDGSASTKKSILATNGSRLNPDVTTNLLTNPRLTGSVGGSPGTAPTGWTFGSSTGASSDIGFASDGVSKIISQSGTAQRPYLQQAMTALALGQVVITQVVIEEVVSGTPTFIDCLSRTGAAVGTSLYFINGAPGTSARAVATGNILTIVFTCTTAGANSIRVGLGCNGNITAAIKFSRPVYYIGS